MNNADSVNKAQQIMDHIEGSSSKRINGAFGGLKRKDYNALRQQIANLIEGKPATETVAAELPKTAAADKVTPAVAKSADKAKPAQA